MVHASTSPRRANGSCAPLPPDSRMLALHQVVRVLRDIPDQGVTRGMVGAVVEAFETPRRAYEIELVDAQGKTLRQATLVESDLEPVPR
jgi:uncharacterized protein DUF4926